MIKMCTGRHRAYYFLISLVFLLFCFTENAHGQDAAPGRERWIQSGVGIVPGFGIQSVYVVPRDFYTAEAALYVDATPQFLGGEGSVQTSLGIGGAIRPLGIIRVIGNTPYSGYDLDVGLRFGPALFFAFNETRGTKNQRFSLFLEPFIRLTTMTGGGTVIFAEAGIQRPLFRAGFWIPL